MNEVFAFLNSHRKNLKLSDIEKNQHGQEIRDSWTPVQDIYRERDVQKNKV